MSAGHLFCFQKGHVMNNDQIKGHAEEVKGKVKEITGRLMGDEAQELEGALQHRAGKTLAAGGAFKSRLRKGVG